ncbi:MAG: DUF4058 family protein [Chloroflexota bacterium]
MSYPFPGMNPWLEESRLWKNVHNTLIVAIRDELVPLLRPHYFVGIETHTYIAQSSGSQSPRYPDVAIFGNRSSSQQPAMRASSAAVLDAATVTPLEVELPHAEKLEYAYLTIETLPDREVITVIEVLSHANKHKG